MSRRSIVIAAILGFVLVAYIAWPWYSVVPGRFGPLKDYQLYDAAVDPNASPGGTKWRAPASRLELVLAREHELIGPKSEEKTARPQAPKPSREKAQHEPLQILPDDSIKDFVIDKGASYGYPETREELEGAISRSNAERASSFFRRLQYHDKPFFGEIPTSLCHWNGHSEWGVSSVSQFQIRKDFKLINVTLESPGRPEVFIVAGGNIYGAQRSAYERSAPIAYSRESFWAVVFAGTGSSSAPYVIDRVRVGEKEAEVTLYRPQVLAVTSDSVSYWYFIPLGCLPGGPYTVKVRSANSGDIQSSATAALRRATDQEQVARNAYWENEQTAGNKHYKKLKDLEELHAAGLQLRLERLAEFVHALPPSDGDRDVLSGDVVELGKAADWDRNIYQSSNRMRRQLAPPTPGEAIAIGGLDLRRDSVKTPWESSGVSLSDVWMCDGTDAAWYASDVYRRVPKLEQALTTADPSPIQRKVREIWKTVDEKHRPPGNDKTRSFSAAGTLESVIDQAYRVIVKGEDRPMEFAPDDNIWVVYIASSSYLIRQIETRHYEDRYRHTKHRGFMIHTSAYIAGADGVEEADFAPVTLALIPLGKPGEVDSVSVEFSCRSVCCRDIEAGDENKLLDVRPPDNWYSRVMSKQDYGAGFQVTRNRPAR